MSANDTVPGIEERLRAALGARADLVRPEDLEPLAAPVVELRPAWRSPWVLLATAAAVLLVLGVVLQGVGGRPRSEQIAPQPDRPQLDLPVDVGRDWQPDDLSEPARLDLDGDGRGERVEFLAEPTSGHDGRTRVQTTLSSTGEEAFGVVELGTTIGVNALQPVDADADGDQELVLYTTDLQGGPGAPFEPVVLDLRDGLLVQAVPSDPALLSGGYAVVPGSETEHYDLVHVQSFEVRRGTLVSTRSVEAFARASGSMTLLTPETYVMDTYAWTLDEAGVLRPGEPGCAVHEPEATTACDADSADDLPYVTSESTETIGAGQQVALDDGGLGHRVRVEDDGSGPVLVVDGPGADGAVHALDVPDPRVHVVSPAYLAGYDAAAVLVSSASDASAMEVVVQAGDQAGLVRLRPVGEVPLGSGTTDDGRRYRSWLTGAGIVVTAVAADDGSWETWQWVRSGDDGIAPLPWGTVCFDDVDDPTTGRRC
ncbi:hypothetical protein [Nocardioides zeicaulis]|uniref:VCBS repeat-containing protein n=1 Tax=Nocardioides zeicaulis TaxID=1776857 RepID=A0ABV6E593_9ACTN